MKIRELTPELAKLAADELGEVPSRIPEDLQTIKDWLAKQRHISSRIDDQWLVAFLRGCKFSLQRVKEKLDNYYTMKTMIPEITMVLDTKDSAIMHVLKVGYVIPLPKPTGPAGRRVLVARPAVCEQDKCTIYDCMRVSHMLTEILMMEDDHSVISGQIFLLDLKGTTLAHFAQMTPSLAKKLVMSGEQAVPIRQKGAHYLHTPPGVETLFNVFKAFMSEKLKQRIYVHNEDYDALHRAIPKEILPLEYKGDAGPIDDMIDHWVKKVESYRDWFADNEKFKTDESKRPGKPRTAEDLFGLDGSFRKLNVD